MLLFLEGGGTKLDATLYANNQPVEQLHSGACNLTLNFHGARKNIFDLIDQFDITKIDKIIISAAGVYSNPDLAEQLSNEIFDKYMIAIKVIPDVVYHYYKYFLSKKGLVVNLGTGTSAFSIVNNQKKLSFGYGPIFSEPGCGHDIGIKLFQYLSLKEGNNEKSLLLNKLLKDFGFESIRREVRLFNNFRNNEIAKYAKWVLDLTNDSDELLRQEAQTVVLNSLSGMLSWLTVNGGFAEIFFIGGIANNDFVQNEITKVVTNPHFNAEVKYTLEDIWNLLSD